MAGFILRGLVAALGLWAASELFAGISIDSALTLVFAGLLVPAVAARAQQAAAANPTTVCGSPDCQAYPTTQPALLMPRA